MRREAVSKSYENRLKRELLPYLTKTTKVGKVTKFDKDRYSYRFEINAFKNDKAKEFFDTRVERFATWKRRALGIYEWETESQHLYNLYLESKEKHDDIADALKYAKPNLCNEVFLKEYECEFINENGDKQMSKLQINRTINVKVNGKAFSLGLPIKPEHAQEAVKELLDRENTLRSEKELLGISDSKTKKLEDFLQKEITEISEIIAEINDNIE